MAYDEALAARIRTALKGRPEVTERKRVGGIAFMVAGNMAVGVIGEDLMARVGPDAHDDALAEPHVRPMDFAGRPMKGMVYVGPDGVATDDDLRGWVDRSAEFAARLPPK